MSFSSGERPLLRTLIKRCSVSNQNGAPSDAANPVKNQPRTALNRCPGSRRYCHCDSLHPIGTPTLVRLFIATFAVFTSRLTACVASSVILGAASIAGAVLELALACGVAALTVFTAWLTVSAKSCGLLERTRIIWIVSTLQRTASPSARPSSHFWAYRLYQPVTRSMLRSYQSPMPFLKLARSFSAESKIAVRLCLSLLLGRAAIPVWKSEILRTVLGSADLITSSTAAVKGSTPIYDGVPLVERDKASTKPCSSTCLTFSGSCKSCSRPCFKKSARLSRYVSQNSFNAETTKLNRR